MPILPKSGPLQQRRLRRLGPPRDADQNASISPATHGPFHDHSGQSHAGWQMLDGTN